MPATVSFPSFLPVPPLQFTKNQGKQTYPVSRGSLEEIPIINTISLSSAQCHFGLFIKSRCCQSMLSLHMLEIWGSLIPQVSKSCPADISKKRKLPQKI